MILKTAVTAITLMCFAFSYVIPNELVYVAAHARAIKKARELKRPKPETPASRLAAELHKADRILGDGARLSKASRHELRAIHESVRTEGELVLAEFAEIAERIDRMGLPQAVKDRHRAQWDRAIADLDSLSAALDELDAAKPQSMLARIKMVQRAVETARGPVRHNPIDPEKLPFRPSSDSARSLSTTTKEFESALMEGKDASARITSKATPPDPADLVETLDVQFTEGIQELADSLEGDPLAIYNWVRQQVTFVPTFGSIQGSEGCRVSLECNAHDASSLLIAMLRVSGVPARYVTGTLEVDPDLFRSALGDFEDVAAAARLASSGGIPTVLVVDGGGEVVAVRMEHTWVEAFVDYVPSRGAAGDVGDTWVPLDPVLKNTRFQPPVDVATAAATELEAVLQEIQASGTEGPDGSLTGISEVLALDHVTQLSEAFKAYVDTEMPDATVSEVIGAVEIETPVLGVLPASLPGRVLAAGGRFSELPPSSHHQLSLQVMDSFGLSEDVRLDRATAELAGHRVTIGYVPASEDDATTIESFGGLYSVPPYLVDLRPVIFIDGEPKAAGSPIMMGTTQKIRVSFHEPGSGSDWVEHLIPVGTFAALGLDLQRVSEVQANASKASLEQIMAEGLDVDVDSSWDDLIGGPLHAHGLSYFLQVESSNRMTAHGLNVVAVKRPAELLVSYTPAFSYLFGSAVDISNLGFNIDVRRYVVSVASRVGDRDAELAYLQTTGSFASAAEHTVFEHLQGARSVSAIKLIGEANAQGIPIFTVDDSNLSQVLPLLELSSPVLNDIQNSVNAGKEVIVPKQEFAYLEWSGVGYIVMDPDTGAAGYLISGGLSGGGTAEGSESSDLLSDIVAFLSWVANELSGLAGILKASSKLAAGLKFLSKFSTVFGNLIIGLSAIVTAYTTYEKTGSVWKALAAGAIDLIVSLAVGAAITALAGVLVGGWGIVILVAAIVVISIVAYLLVSFLTDLIVNAMKWYADQKDRYAWQGLRVEESILNGLAHQLLPAVVAA